jgi:hypothetical protein
MTLTGALSRLLTAQGMVGVVLAVLANGRDRPAAAWTLGFLGFVLLSTGVVLWVFASAAEANAMKEAAARGRQRAAGGAVGRVDP